MLRRLVPALLFLVIPLYVGFSLISAFTPAAPVWLLGAVLLSAVYMLVNASMRTRQMADRRLAERIAWIGLTAMGLFSSLFALTVLRDVALGVLRLFSAPLATMWVRPSALAVIALALLMTVIGFAVARRPRVIRVDIPLHNLPAALQGFSIVQISDVHVGPTIKRAFVEHVVSMVNALNADLVAVTGDLVDGTVQQLSAHTAPFAGLRARHGTFFVTGNHEYYSGERSWTEELRRLGMRVLKNEHVLLDHDGASLLVAGVTDYSAHHYDAAQKSDPAGALSGARAGSTPKILLAHQPSTAPAAAQAGYDVQLSGHTHGGQFWPWNLLVGFFQPFTGGLHRLKAMWIYVSRGTGYWGPPNRFGVPSEITHIRLISA